MSPLFISLLMVAGFAVFGVMAWRKLAIVAALAPDNRFDRLGERTLRLLKMGIGQSRLLTGDFRPGLMHAVIFIGFMTLLVRKLHLIVIGYWPEAVIPGAFGAAYTAWKDFVELAVLAAVAFGFWRRFVRRPRRLEPNREALLVLGLITLIMLTDFGFDAFRFAKLAPVSAAVAHEQAWAWVGGPLAAGLQGLSPAAIEAGYHLFYWVQMLTVFTFLAILPIGEHFHIVTALPAVFFGREAPLNRVPTVDLAPLAEDDADPDQLAIGAKTALDLTWKEGLDAFTCTECGRCKDACPTFLTGKPLSLKWVNDAVKHHLVDEREQHQGGRARQAAGAGGRADQRGDAVVVHHLRLLRGRVPDRHRAPRQVLPAAAAAGDDGRRVPGRAEQAVPGVRVGGQSVGPRRRGARRLGEGRSACRSCRRRTKWPRSTTCTTSARRRRSIRAARRSRARSSRSPRPPA